jgi:hypothetical protein
MSASFSSSSHAKRWLLPLETDGHKYDLEGEFALTVDEVGICVAVVDRELTAGRCRR